jgi:hypothetical protein
MQEVLDLQAQALSEIASAGSTAELRDLKIKFLGTNGLISV